MIESVKVVPLAVRVDDRGYLIEIARRADDDEPHAVIHRFGQVYLVGDVTRGTVRAFHKHEELWDWFFISHGSAKFVLKDDREDSSTYGEMMTIVTGERNPRLDSLGGRHTKCGVGGESAKRALKAHMEEWED